jgi:hypothetical protein
MNELKGQLDKIQEELKKHFEEMGLQYEKRWIKWRF